MKSRAKYQKQWRKTHPLTDEQKQKRYLYNKQWHIDNPEKSKEYSKKYREENKEKVRMYKKKYADNNIEKEKARREVWRKANLEKDCERVRRRYYKKLGIIEKFTVEEWLEKKQKANGICPKCNKKRGLTLDHIYPISKAEFGRVYTIDDIQPLCRSCNASKGDTI